MLVHKFIHYVYGWSPRRPEEEAGVTGRSKLTKVDAWETLRALLLPTVALQCSQNKTLNERSRAWGVGPRVKAYYTSMRNWFILRANHWAPGSGRGPVSKPKVKSNWRRHPMLTSCLCVHTYRSTRAHMPAHAHTCRPYATRMGKDLISELVRVSPIPQVIFRGTKITTSFQPNLSVVFRYNRSHTAGSQ